ncbi:hypothetical protein FHT21_002635 [Pedobacter sp. SG908]|nr:hypothetical protein [Pedobacter sp. SG908]
MCWNIERLWKWRVWFFMESEAPLFALLRYSPCSLLPGLFYKGEKLLANGLKSCSGKLKLNKKIKLRARHSRACGNHEVLSEANLNARNI